MLTNAENNFTRINVERIDASLASIIHEMPPGLSRDERREFILAVANILTNGGKNE